MTSPVERIWEYLERCTARLEISGGSHGSGTLVGPGLLVTCSHVLPDAEHSMRLYIGGKEVAWRLAVRLMKPEPDLALLLLDDVDHEWVDLNPQALIGQRVFIFGYPDDMPDGDSVTGELEGTSNAARGRDLKFKAGQVRPGLSGAPLLNLDTKSVCGIVRTTRSRATDLGGRAVPAAEVFELLKRYEQSSRSRIDLKMTPRWEAILSSERDGVVGPTATKQVHGSLEAAQFFCGRGREMEVIARFCQGQLEAHILTVVGIGGSGKTALIQQFLQSSDWSRSDSSSTEAQRLFAWSFYDYPNTGDFLQAATEYFAGDAPGAIGTLDRLLTSLSAFDGRSLIVLDGLERMQAAGDRGGLPRGMIEDPPLRQFVLAMADGYAPAVRVIVTSRFALADFSTRRSGYHELPLDDLEKDEAAELLSRIGVKSAAEPILGEFGCHALTIDLLGRLLVEFFDAELRLKDVLPTLQTSIGTPAVEKQAYRLARVLGTYQRCLAPAEVALLQRVSLFRRPVDEGFLLGLIASEGTGAFAGCLRDYSEFERRSYLRRLVLLRLLSVEVSEEGIRLISCHPTVRDFFYTSIGDVKELHGAIRERLLSLAERPAEPKEPQQGQWDLIEELIYHTVMLGMHDEAFQIYRDRLGYLRIGWERGDHARGVNLLRLIGGQVEVPSMQLAGNHAIRYGLDSALYLKNLGALDEAIGILRSLSEAADIDPGDRALVLQNLSAVQVLRGWLPEAEVAAMGAVEHADSVDDPRLLRDCQVRLATALGLQGKVDMALEQFENAVQVPDGARGTIRDVLSLRHAGLLVRLGRAHDALEVLMSGRSVYAEGKYGIIVARFDILLAECYAALGGIDDGLVAVERVFQWITAGTDQEMVIAADIARARLARAAGDPTEVATRTVRAARHSRQFGYVTYWVDATILNGWAELANHQWRQACALADEVLEPDGGVGGLIVGATNDRVRYFWGERDAVDLRSQALRLGNK